MIDWLLFLKKSPFHLWFYLQKQTKKKMCSASREMNQYPAAWNAISIKFVGAAHQWVIPQTKCCKSKINIHFIAQYATRKKKHASDSYTTTNHNSFSSGFSELWWTCSRWGNSDTWQNEQTRLRSKTNGTAEQSVQTATFCLASDLPAWLPGETADTMVAGVEKKGLT